MADPEVRISIATEDTGDVEMEGDAEDVTVTGAEGLEEETQEAPAPTRTAYVE